MNKKRLRVMICLLAFGAALVPAGLLEDAFSELAQGDDSQILTLEGLKAVSVNVVQPVSGFEDNPNFNPVEVLALREAVQRLLNDAGIEVFEKRLDDPEIGHVVVTINAWKDRVFAKFIVQIKTQLYQHAALLRDNRVQMMVPTWPLGDKALETETPVVVTRSELAGTVRKEVESQVKTFIRDYLEANLEPEPKPDISNMMTGTIKYVDLEGGYYNILADNGRSYHPVNLPREYRRHGLRIAFRAVLLSGTVGIHSGIYVEITRITKL
jgi:hypothetical protein